MCALCLQKSGIPRVLKGGGHVFPPCDHPMGRSWATVPVGLPSALDQCLGGLLHGLLQKPDALQPAHLSGGFPAGGAGLLPCSTEPDNYTTVFPGCCRGMPPPVSGFSSRRASWSQLHLSGTETMRRDSPPPGPLYHPIPVLSTLVLEPTPAAPADSSKVC